MSRARTDKCPLCGGRMTEGSTTFTADLGFGVVVVRQVPARVCSQCHSEWMKDDAAEQIEEIVADARKRQLTVEVTTLPKAS